MNIEKIGLLFLWCAVINYCVIFVWFLLFVTLHNQLYQLHGRWFRLSIEQFNALNYGGMMIYKLGILLFNLVPYIALRIVVG